MLSILVALSSCKSDAQKYVDNAIDISDEYIERLKNATSKEEIIELRKEHGERIEHEFLKTMGEDTERKAENKMQSILNESDWNEVQNMKNRMKESKKRTEHAEDEAFKRFE